MQFLKLPYPKNGSEKPLLKQMCVKKHGINIMAIKRDVKMNLNFAPETSFIPGNTIGDTKNIQKFFHI